MDQQHQVGAAVVVDVDDQRLARFEVAPFVFASKTLLLEDLEAESRAERGGHVSRGRCEIQNLDVVRPRVDHCEIGLTVAVQIAADDIGEECLFIFRFEGRQFFHRRDRSAGVQHGEFALAEQQQVVLIVAVQIGHMH